MRNFPTLVTERLDLVEIQQSHLKDLFTLFGNRKVTEFYNLLPLVEEQEGQKLLDWFQSRFKDELGIRWGIALKAVIDFGFNELDINRIEAEVMQGNIASEKLLEKQNFTKEGVLRKWMFWNGQHYDMTMYSLLKNEYRHK
ncbi:MAG: GNAT family N-acetyltransferase [Tannerellaceae bacterium]|jgi:ribosomal-protein-alanine N-acetyltransferase|nr:GNAT family N-acetyltransferase [Tannerellaceae bacterium]